MKTQKNCLDCNKEFKGSHTWQIYCSRKCFGNKNRKPITQKSCLTCNKSFEVRPGEINKNYCSRKCGNLSRRKSIKKQCENCNKSFEARPCYANQKYCSRKCYHLPRQRKIKKTCLACEKQFEVKPGKNYRKFCSNKCHGTYRKQPKKRSICLECKKEFEVLWWPTQKVCSQECSKRYFVGKNSHTWRGGLKSEPYDLNWTKRLKRSIRKRDNNTCQVCGGHRSQFKRALSIHHINYVKTDSVPSNLISLCDGCHRMTNFRRRSWQVYFEELLKIEVERI